MTRSVKRLWQNGGKLATNSSMHIVLLGDSIFDNKSYVGDGDDTITSLRSLMDTEKATLLAVDGSVVSGVERQLKRLPKDATNLVISVGGNDALGEMSILEQAVEASAEVFYELHQVGSEFEKRYEAMLKAVKRYNLPITLCTIYYPRFEHPVFQNLACSALATFNDVIIRQAVLNNLPLIDLRLVCNEDADYANPIEPSEQGGMKIAQRILKVCKEHDFAKPTTVYA